MKIAFTHNLQRHASLDEAEFDTAPTVEAISAALERLGHRVFAVEVSRPLDEVIDELARIDPDLVFNTAEGYSGRSREAVYPMIFEQLGVPFTGSDAFACTTTLDKRLSKLLVASRGVPTPKAALVEDPGEVPDDLRFPVIVKPNFEGSSKGIGRDSVVHEPDQLSARIAEVLADYPEGVLVEEFIVGEDVVVPFLEGASPETGGVLPPAQYRVRRLEQSAPGFAVYDYDLKHEASEAVDVEVPARLGGDVLADLAEYARRAVSVLDVRDVGRLDFRVTPDGEIFFLEMNALPSLEPGASIYASAELVGLPGIDPVLGAIVESACARHGLDPQADEKQAPSRMGLIYNLKRGKLAPGGSDAEAEFDSAQTIEALGRAIEKLGYEVVPIEATPELPARLERAHIDLAFNIAEGYGGRSRESTVPALLDLLGIPYTGSDATAMALTLDKGIAKRLVAHAGVDTPDFVVIEQGDEGLPAQMNFPVIVKPLAEGTSKGIGQASVCTDADEALERAGELLERYPSGALVEEYLSGREFTIGLLGERDPRMLPPMEIVFGGKQKFPVYSYAHKLDADASVGFEVPARLDDALRARLEKLAKKAFAVLGCRDFARIDVRLDDAGVPHFIECNPLPGLAPGFSDLCVIAQAAGLDYDDLVAEILAPALARLRADSPEPSQPVIDQPTWNQAVSSAVD